MQIQAENRPLTFDPNNEIDNLVSFVLEVLIKLLKTCDTSSLNYANFKVKCVGMLRLLTPCENVLTTYWLPTGCLIGAYALHTIMLGIHVNL